MAAGWSLAQLGWVRGPARRGAVNPSMGLQALTRRGDVVMNRNEGTLDRTVRVLLGLALLALVFVGPRSWLGLIGLIPLLRGVVGFCPLYKLMGIRTSAAQ